MTSPTTSLTRKTSTTRMCGVIKVIDGEDHAVAMLGEQAQLWDRLTMEEGRFRKRFRAVLHATSPDLAAVDSELTAIRQGAAPSTGDAGARVHELSAKGNRLRKAAIKACKPELQELDSAHALALRKMASESGLWWLHSESVLNNFRTARVQAHQVGRHLWSKPFFGEGSLAIRFTAGSIKLDWAGFESGKSRLASLQEATSETLGPRMKAIKGDGGRRCVLRVATGAPDHEGIYPTISLLVTLHRDMPRDLTIRTLTLRRSVSAGGAGESMWSASFTFGGQRIPPRAPNVAKPLGMVASEILAVGGSPRHMGGSGQLLRVASYAIGDDVSTVMLPAEWLSANRRLASQRTVNVSAIASLHEQMKLALLGRADLRDDAETSGLVSAITTGPASPSTLIRMVGSHETSLERFGDDLGASLRSAATSLERSMTEADRISRRLSEQRLHIFRNAASRLVRQCRAISIGEPEISASNATDAEQADRRGAGYSLLVTCIKHAAGRDGVPVTMFKNNTADEHTRQNIESRIPVQWEKTGT